MGIDISADSISSKVFDNFKKLTPALLSLAIISGSLLFLPESILQKMALGNLSESVKRIVGTVFLLSVALILTIVFFSLVRMLYANHRHKRFIRDQQKKLERLSQQQKSIITALMQSDDKTIKLNANSGDTIYLQTNLFIHQPQQFFSVGCDDEMIMTYVPEPWLIDLYNTKHELFK